MKKAAILLLILLLPFQSRSAQRRDLLTGTYNRDAVAPYCSSGTDWVRFPAYSDRQAWGSIPEAKRKATIAQGEKYLGYDWPSVLPTMYLEFSRSGNRQVVDNAISRRLTAIRSLFFAEMAEGQGRFIDDIINGIYAYCEQTYWGASAHFYLYEYGDSISDPKAKVPDDQNPVIDLTVGDVASTLSWIWYFLHDEFDKVTPAISDRLLREMRKKVLEPYYSKNDFWWITGWNTGNVNNWTPWCSYNVLTAILLLETDPEKKLSGVYKTMRSVDLFINSYPDDGGCSEGPSYWGAAVGHLYNYLSLLGDWSGGGIDIFRHGIITEMGRYVYKLYIGDGVRYVNFADAPASLTQDGPKIVRYGRDIGDPDLEAFGAFLAEKSGFATSPLSGDVGSTFYNVFSQADAPAPREILVPDAWLPDLQVAAARDKEGSQEGFFFAAKGGDNGEQHNHNDVGSFVLYLDGKPVFVDPGVGTYTRETFSGDRFKIWTMQSAYHNLPIINGVIQREGGAFKASSPSFKATAGKVEFTVDIAGAYPEDAKVSSWTRKYTLERGRRFIVSDRYSLKENSGEGTEIVYMTPLPCALERGSVVLSGDGFTVTLSFPEGKAGCRIEEKVLDDPRLRGVWGQALYRIVFNVKGSSLKDSLSFEIKASR